MRFEDVNEVEKVSCDIQIFLNHVVDLFLDNCIEFGCVKGLVLVATKHELECIDGHQGLLISLFVGSILAFNVISPIEGTA